MRCCGRYGEAKGSNSIRDTGLPLGARYTARSTTFLSSRILPGQSWFISAAAAPPVKPAKNSCRSCLTMPLAKCSARGRMSSCRRRSGGRVSTSKDQRSSKSSRNRPSAANAGRSALAAPTMRTSTSRVSFEPTRSNCPYSTTRNSFSCNRSDIEASSSRNNVPPSADSKRPARDLLAPV